MPKKLTLQTAAAFERIYEALVGKTDDDLSSLSLHLQELLNKAQEIQEISSCFNSGDC